MKPVKAALSLREIIVAEIDACDRPIKQLPDPRFTVQNHIYSTEFAKQRLQEALDLIDGGKTT